MDGRKLCQKMRLGALIIFLIEWRHQVSYLGGKQSKYCNKENIQKNVHVLCMHSVYAFDVGILWCFWIEAPNNIKNEAEKSCFLIDGWKLCQKMRLDALIIFLIEWRHHVSYLGGKQSIYCNKKKGMHSMYVFYDVLGRST